MLPDSITLSASEQEVPTYLITNDYASLCRWLNTCPAADLITAYSLTLERTIFLQTRCRRWSCPHCGPRRIGHLTRKVQDAKPTKFVTLTVANNLFESPRDAYDRTRRSIGLLTRKIRDRVGEWEYLRVLEVTKKGYPHYHFAARGGFVDQHWLSAQWDVMTGAHIVDIRPIKSQVDACKYLMKYLYKQKAISWTNRRVCWTRSFFPPPSSPSPQKLDLLESHREGMPPASYFVNYLPGQTLERLGPDMWALALKGA